MSALGVLCSKERAVALNVNKNGTCAVVRMAVVRMPKCQILSMLRLRDGTGLQCSETAANNNNAHVVPRLRA
jgi:hypothetical protein